MSLKMPVPTAVDRNRMTYELAARLKAEMSRPGGQPEKLDFSLMSSCFHCDRQCHMSLHPTGLLKPLVCSACKSVVYCSKKCQIANWKNGRLGTDGHKIFCEKYKRHMQRVPEVRAILKLFPWGRVESDGTFPESIIRAYFDVLGTNGFGYWSEADGSAPHQVQPNTLNTRNYPFLIEPSESYQDGYLLLLDQHLDDNAGWKLEDKFIPKLRFEPGHEPLIASSANIVNWASWYQWRSLPLESPAALLMHFPLSVYHLCVNVLRVASPMTGSSKHRQTLDIHYLGAEVELNMLPLFSELALLLPHTDIKLTFFGYAVYTIVQKAPKKSIADKAKKNEPVYTYKAPASMGQSTLAIYLQGEHENWGPHFISMGDHAPDVVVALNAGLLNYHTWVFVILFCIVENLPFGVTEYAEQSAEEQAESFSKFIHHALPSLGPRLNTALLEDLVRPRDYPIEFNPFQRPGQRPMGTIRLPSVSNGFTIKVVGRNSVITDRELARIPEEQLRQLAEKTLGLSLNNLD